MPRHDDVQMRIRADSGIVKWFRRHERIVFGRNHQRGHANAVDDAHRAGAEVVIARALKRKMRCGEVLVEVAHGPDLLEPFDWKAIRMQRRLPAYAGLEQANEVPLIDEVLPPL